MVVQYHELGAQQKDWIAVVVASVIVRVKDD